MEPIKPNTNKVSQTSLGLSFSSSSPDDFPIVYADNVWDVVNSGTNLAELLENIGQFDQHTINELFARILIEGIGADTSFNNDFNNDFGN
jgi:hypothetical protein